jgi:hypothetical protein
VIARGPLRNARLEHALRDFYPDGTTVTEQSGTSCTEFGVASIDELPDLDRYLQSTTWEPIGIGPDRFDEAGVRVLPE